MAECFKCGVSDEKAWLFDAIGAEGIVKICRNCQEEEGIPLIKRPSSSQIENSQRVQPLRDRLALSSELDSKGRDRRSLPKEQQEFLKKQETSLKDIVDRNFQLQISDIDKKKSRDDLIEHFHWVIMRARRGKKITAAQLAMNIGESEMAIKMAEQGTLGKDSDRLLTKLENYLGIRIFKRGMRPTLVTGEGMVLPGKQATEKLENSSWKTDSEIQDEGRISKGEAALSFDRTLAKNVRVSDLQKMEDKRREEIFKDELEDVPKQIEDLDIEEDAKDMLRKEELMEKRKEEDNEDISDEEMDDIIFGRG